MVFPFDSIARWVPYKVDFNDLGDYLGNRSIYANTFPENEKSSFIEKALLRERIRSGELVISKDNNNFIVPKDVTRFAKNPVEEMVLILDGLTPSGICLFEGKGVAICFEGSSRIKDGEKGSIIATITVDLGLTKKQKMEIRFDELFVIPVALSEKVSLKIELTNGFSLLGKKNVKLDLKGDGGGIVIDSRGRPFIFPSADKFGRDRVKKWIDSI